MSVGTDSLLLIESAKMSMPDNVSESEHMYTQLARGMFAEYIQM